MPQPLPQDNREQALQKIREARVLLRQPIQESTGGHQKSAAERISEGRIYDEANLLLKEAFSLGPAGQKCPSCGGSGRA